MVGTEATALAAVAVHNVVVHRLLPAPASAAINVLSAGGLIAAARRVGCSAEELGMSLEDAPSGVATGLAAGGLAAAVVAATARCIPRMFRDRRITSVSPAGAAGHLALRIPFATSLAEEALFRGALLGLFRRRGSTRAAVAANCALFGAWHILPAFDALRSGAAPELLTDNRQGRVLWALATVAGTAAAGGLLAWLRLRSRSLLAPILAHALLNATGYVATRSATK
jgi:membrane protease YdiL (CAAX protease family)